ncbi:hypothetical protein [Paramicrobacterium chengjingii]|uniref:Uncharacterized protein n=1 Tax=Paramicrobacterium chengjingii TaxID=2769067 RepID=A0ABX6YLG1_9MICO|nr:hypothetical protein [Microbacterium chengjingii]QPZ39656.1 hypothetical protein HCR76_06290 [Microbacterium chengjingii]
MELLFVMLFGIAAGLAARYALPWRPQHGSMLVPAIGTIASAVVWIGLTWLGWAWDGGWIWAVSIAASVVVSVCLDLVIGSVRNSRDAAMLASLGA